MMEPGMGKPFSPQQSPDIQFGRDRPDDFISAEDLERSTANTTTTVRSLSNVDILFVIDNTLSMKPYMNDVRNAVRDFVRRYGTVGADNEGLVLKQILRR